MHITGISIFTFLCINYHPEYQDYIEYNLTMPLCEWLSPLSVNDIEYKSSENINRSIIIFFYKIQFENIFISSK